MPGDSFCDSLVINRWMEGGGDRGVCLNEAWSECRNSKRPYGTRALVGMLSQACAALQPGLFSSLPSGKNADGLRTGHPFPWRFEHLKKQLQILRLPWVAQDDSGSYEGLYFPILTASARLGWGTEVRGDPHIAKSNCRSFDSRGSLRMTTLGYGLRMTTRLMKVCALPPLAQEQRRAKNGAPRFVGIRTSQKATADPSAPVGRAG